MLRIWCLSNCISSWVHLFTLPILRYIAFWITSVIIFSFVLHTGYHSGCLPIIPVDLMSLAMSERVLGHMRTAKVQISLRIRAGWSGLSLSATDKMDTLECFIWEQMPVWDGLCACAGWCVSAHLRMFEGVCETIMLLYELARDIYQVIYRLTLVLLNPDIHCLCKQWRSRSVGFFRSQLIWICTVCHLVCEFESTTWIKWSDWL